VNAHRNLTQNSEVSAKNLERLSSGLKVNRGADGPAALQVSERLRAQTAGLDQAIENSQVGISLMQTTEAALDEVSRALINARQLAVHAANEAVNDPFMLQADQQEVNHILETVDRIAKDTQFGSINLLDGSAGTNGVTNGAGLEFIGATEKSQSSGVNGYEVTITHASTRAEHVGAKPLSQSVIDAGEQITLTEGGKTANFTTREGETVEQTLNRLGEVIKDSGLALELLRPEPGTTDGKLPQAVHLRHKQFGSEHNFTVASSSGGVLSAKGNTSEMVQNGTDVEGEINGGEASGRGQVLTGAHGAESVEGVQVRYGEEKAPAGGFAGTVTVSQNSRRFQVGANDGQMTAISLRSTHSWDLGKAVSNESGFNSLKDVNVLQADKATDSIRVIDKALEEVNSFRGQMGVFQANSLESNLNYLRIARENVIGSESVIRDADMADEMMQNTRNQIMLQSSTAMLVQANQNP
jgi:flagellin